MLSAPLLASGCLSLNEATSSKPNHSSEPQVLATINQLDTYPIANKGNQAQLIKEAYGFCQIEFTGFYETGKIVENWAFKNNKLISASTTKFSYVQPLSALNQQIAAVQSTPFNINEVENIKNFEKLKANFSKRVLNQCI